MKKDIHPAITRPCSLCVRNEFETGSTMKEIKVEICSNCHPLFTGKQKLDGFHRERVGEIQEQVCPVQ